MDEIKDILAYAAPSDLAAPGRLDGAAMRKDPYGTFLRRTERQKARNALKMATQQGAALDLLEREAFLQRTYDDYVRCPDPKAKAMFNRSVIELAKGLDRNSGNQAAAVVSNGVNITVNVIQPASKAEILDMIPDEGK